MKKVIVLTLLLGLVSVTSKAQDDLYFTPKKSSKVEPVEEKVQEKPVVYRGSERDVKGSSQRTERLIIVQREDEALAEGQSERDDRIGLSVCGNDLRHGSGLHLHRGNRLRSCCNRRRDNRRRSGKRPRRSFVSCILSCPLRWHRAPPVPCLQSGGSCLPKEH